MLAPPLVTAKNNNLALEPILSMYVLMQFNAPGKMFYLAYTFAVRLRN